MYKLNHINRLFMNLTKQLLAMITLSIPVRQQWKMLHILVNVAIQSQQLVTGGCLGVFLGELDHHLKKRHIVHKLCFPGYLFCSGNMKSSYQPQISYDNLGFHTVTEITDQSTTVWVVTSLHTLQINLRQFWVVTQLQRLQISLRQFWLLLCYRCCRSV